MLITYARSSSLSQLDMCQQKYFLTYNLGMRDRTNIKAVLGTVIHRVLQCLADKKFASMNGKKTVDFEGKRLKLAQCDDIELVTKLSFEYYTSLEPNLVFKNSHFNDCVKWVNSAITHCGGSLDPRNQDVFATEKFFDFEIDKPWADYRFTLDKQEISGKFSIKGTVDLILKENDKTLHVLDYKSGRRLNWATFKEKSYEDLEYDPQLLLYYYALKNVYPDYDFVVSIYYINDGGLFSFVYDDHHYERAENMLRQKFEFIKSIEIPKMLSPDNSAKTCQYLCGFKEPYGDSGKSICQHFNSLIREQGLLKVVNDYADFNSLGKYTGGGRVDQ